MNDNPKKIRCGTCGRFLGYEYMEKGMVLIYCPNCKQFNEIITEGFNVPFTEQELHEIIKK